MKRKYNQGVADANRRRTRHGATVDARKGKKDSLYQRWFTIKHRCTNSNHQHYHRYGGRGITMHPAWVEDFEAFRQDVGYPPGPNLTLDRIDNDGNYEPGNVRWATRKEQANNRATNVRIEYEGATRTLAEWADYLQWPYSQLSGRWKAGKRGDELFSPPDKVSYKSKVMFNGESRTLREWAHETGVPYFTLYWRRKNGKPLF